MNQNTIDIMHTLYSLLSFLGKNQGSNTDQLKKKIKEARRIAQQHGRNPSCSGPLMHELPSAGAISWKLRFLEALGLVEYRGSRADEGEVDLKGWYRVKRLGTTDTGYVCMGDVGRVFRGEEKQEKIEQKDPEIEINCNFSDKNSQKEKGFVGLGSHGLYLRYNTSVTHTGVKNHISYVSDVKQATVFRSVLHVRQTKAITDTDYTWIPVEVYRDVRVEAQYA